jgi:MinD-like ATPase involved in chromosome partitioning or flagellar assembly
MNEMMFSKGCDIAFQTAQGSTFMSDQASDLRRLMMERIRPDGNRSIARRQRIVVSGGKGGVGTTTVAIQLALAETQHKTLLVDADPRGDMALRCGRDDRRTLADLLSRRHRLEEIVQRGPNGVFTVFGMKNHDEAINNSNAASDRLCEAFNETLNVNEDRPAIDTVVVDIGNTPSRLGRRLWETADAAVVVATTETSSIVGAYEALKYMAECGAATPTLVLVNRAASSRLAEIVFQRLAYAGRRFLGLHWVSAGFFAMVPRHRWAEDGVSMLQRNAKVAMHACRRVLQSAEMTSVFPAERIKNLSSASWGADVVEDPLSAANTAISAKFAG